MLAAEGYAKGGFLLKAIAVCKVVLQIEPHHTITQVMLAELYAQRERAAAPAATSGAAPKLTPSVPPRSERPSRPPIARADELLSLDAIALDERPATLPRGAPMDVLPLYQVLGGRPSSELPTVADEPSGAYEIELGDEELSLAAAAAEADAAPAPPAPKDDLDFSGLLDDEPPKPAAPPPAPLAPLPRIPLFSSLSPDRLKHLIERVALRTAEPGEPIVRQGERGGALFVVVRGRVQVVLDGPPPRTLAHLDEGAFFGELALLTDFPRSATVAADEPTELLEISRELVSEIVADSPDVLKTLLRFFRDRMLDRLIGTSPLFSSLSPDDAQKLVERFKFLELEKGVRVVAEGERAPGMFLLLCGEAQVARGGRSVAQLRPGDLFGEMSLLTRAPASASIDTLSKCWTLELPRADFQEIMLTYPQVLEYVSGLAAERSAAADETIDFI
jgi:CRP-like cAMP-binding protein